MGAFSFRPVALPAVVVHTVCTGRVHNIFQRPQPIDDARVDPKLSNESRHERTETRRDGRKMNRGGKVNEIKGRKVGLRPGRKGVIETGEEGSERVRSGRKEKECESAMRICEMDVSSVRIATLSSVMHNSHT